jgi:hypothetical protein
MTPAAAQDTLSAVLKLVMSQSATAAAKTSALGYLCVLGQDAAAANLLINSTLVTSLLRLLRSLKITAVRVKIADALGYFLRFATQIDEKGPASGLASALTELLRDANERACRHLFRHPFLVSRAAQWSAVVAVRPWASLSFMLPRSPRPPLPGR